MADRYLSECGEGGVCGVAAKALRYRGDSEYASSPVRAQARLLMQKALELQAQSAALAAQAVDLPTRTTQPRHPRR